jgi:BirA family transcriptional regulator, biotin operon repressor / biotin---[acetyl-CoA-carboxylase] ligase
VDFELSRSVASELRVVASCPSTNSELLALAVDPGIPSLTALLTLDQTAGRGRLDRTWVAPAGRAIALSVLLRDALRHPLGAWLPLLAGLLLAEAIDEVLPGRVTIKWPNDLLIDGLKVCGILVEVAPNGQDAVIGSGLNLTQTAQQLPVETATSLALAGAALDDDGVDRIVAGYLDGLRRVLDAVDAVDAVRARIVARCSTVGQRVRVALGDGSTLTGVATGLDEAGQLEVRADSGESVAVSVGDVTHVRPALG